MIISEESRRFLGSSSSSYSSEIAEGTALFSGKSNSSVRTNYQGNNSSYKGRSRRSDLYCDHCHLTGHTKAVCYKLLDILQIINSRRKQGHISRTMTLAREILMQVVILIVVIVEISLDVHLPIL